MLKKVLTTMALATILLTSSISANDELTTQGFSDSTAKVETIGAFENIPSENLNSTELKEVGEWYIHISLLRGIEIGSGDYPR